VKRKSHRTLPYGIMVHVYKANHLTGLTHAASSTAFPKFLDGHKLYSDSEAAVAAAICITNAAFW
jgi:hypothetical protein